jgi:hypothetical protein
MTDDLPPLPPQDDTRQSILNDPMWDANSMRTYALAAIATHEAKQRSRQPHDVAEFYKDDDEAKRQGERILMVRHYPEEGWEQITATERCLIDSPQAEFAWAIIDRREG